MNKIVVLYETEKRHQDLLQEAVRRAGSDAEILFRRPDTVTTEELSEAEIIIGNMPPKRLAETKNLKWMQLNSAGADPFIKSGLLKEDVLLTNASGAYGLAISEYLLAVLLYLMKNIALYEAAGREHFWRPSEKVKSIYASKVLVIGLGDIGQEFAKKMDMLGAIVTGIRRNVAEVPSYLKGGLYTMDSLNELLAEADVVVVTLPGTAKTKKLFDAAHFACMKEGSLFLNIGRGSIVDSDALADALNSGHLAGAAVDVTDPEPLPAEHRLWDARNILITPHVSGGWTLPETFERMVRISADNLERYLSGQPLRNLINHQDGTRK